MPYLIRHHHGDGVLSQITESCNISLSQQYVSAPSKPLSADTVVDTTDTVVDATDTVVDTADTVVDTTDTMGDTVYCEPRHPVVTSCSCRLSNVMVSSANSVQVMVSSTAEAVQVSAKLRQCGTEVDNDKTKIGSVTITVVVSNTTPHVDKDGAAMVLTPVYLHPLDNKVNMRSRMAALVTFLHLHDLLPNILWDVGNDIDLNQYNMGLARNMLIRVFPDAMKHTQTEKYHAEVHVGVTSWSTAALQSRHGQSMVFSKTRSLLQHFRVLIWRYYSHWMLKQSPFVRRRLLSTPMGMNQLGRVGFTSAIETKPGTIAIDKAAETVNFQRVRWDPDAERLFERVVSMKRTTVMVMTRFDFIDEV